MNVGGFFRSENDKKQVIMIFIFNCYSTKWVFGSSHKERPTRQETKQHQGQQLTREGPSTQKTRMCPGVKYLSP